MFSDQQWTGITSSVKKDEGLNMSKLCHGVNFSMLTKLRNSCEGEIEGLYRSALPQCKTIGTIHCRHSFLLVFFAFFFFWLSSISPPVGEIQRALFEVVAVGYGREQFTGSV
jgi:predicted membrane metal-binding protein